MDLISAPVGIACSPCRRPPTAPCHLPALDDLDVENRRVFVRVDFNVPLISVPGKESEVRDDSRIRATRCRPCSGLRDRGARLILASHLGRPGRQRQTRSTRWSPSALRLAELLNCEVRLPDEVVGDGVTKLVLDSRAQQIVLLENLRWHPGETKNDPAFAQALANLCRGLRQRRLRRLAPGPCLGRGTSRA